MKIGGGAMPEPKIPDPVKIPSPDDPDLIAARKRKMQEEYSSRSGRASTVLSGDSAGGTYSRSALG